MPGVKTFHSKGLFLTRGLKESAEEAICLVVLNAVTQPIVPLIPRFLE